MHSNAHAMFMKYAIQHMPSGSKVLECGIGKRWWLSPYLKMAAERGWKHFHCDLMNFGSDQPGFVKQSGEYKIDSDPVFDVVFAQQMLEHCRNPFKTVAEMARVTKPGGLVISISPITWKHHRNPIHANAIYPDGIRAVMEEAGLHVVLARMEHICQTPEEKAQQLGRDTDVVDCIGIARKP